MRKILVSAIAAAAIIVPAAPAFAKNDEQLKVTICHNVGHNAHPITVSVNAVGALHGGHGQLDLETSVFTPHDSGGHLLDFLLAIGNEDVEGAADCGPVDGTDGEDGTDGTDGTDGSNGTDGLNGVDGKDGRDGVNGSNGKDADVRRVEQLERIVTELNNRLFLLEHAVPAPVTSVTPPATVPVSQPVGELPHTGSNATMILLGLGLGALVLGGAARRFARR